MTDVPTLPIAATPPADGEPTITIGVGATGPDSFGSDSPLQANQLARDCSSLYPPALLHAKLHLCTQDPTPNQSQACPGDSGSPVMVTREASTAGGGRRQLGR